MTTVREGQRACRGCLFTLGGDVFAVDVRCAREVVALDEFTPVPGAPSYVVGVANVRGHIMPIVDIRPLLGLPRRAVALGTRLLVLEAPPLQAAVVTEAILGLAAFDEVMPLGEARPRQQSAFAIGFVQRDEGPAIVLDVPGILEALRVGKPGPAPDADPRIPATL
jgi:purine-binding chemotaxis protein CheW